MPYVSRTPEKFSYALVAHQGNGGKVSHPLRTSWQSCNSIDMATQISRVNGLYTSSEFAAKAKHSNASFALQKSQLQATEVSLAKIKRKYVFRLMDLPEELRRIILDMATPERAGDWLLPVGLTSLPATRAAGSMQLRLETILIVLQKRVIRVDHYPKEVERWLSGISFGLLQQAGVASCQDAFSAIRRVEITRDSALRGTGGGGGEEESARVVQRFENLRELIVFNKDATKIYAIGADDEISDDDLGTRLREYQLDLPSFNLVDLKRLIVQVYFREFAYGVDYQRDVVSVQESRDILERGCRKVAGWLSKEYSARGLQVTVDVQNHVTYYEWGLEGRP